ncbi:hypothetical protein YYE_03695 [Plasmodium vinckei vinckei]|uniref:Pre-mRNA-splicing factor CWC15 n=1 Tax=Plasmodium vinckei vinckei TaxID=54757 RepID=A0A081ID39_PLAVN|nr:hypothetical protein YYE_03695 [Plasmodium vinckei vinckei]
MTTAHRPTWYNAIGGENQGGNRKVGQTAKVCSRDLPGHTKMKMRDLSDYTEDKEIIKNNLIELENKSSGREGNNNNDGNKLLAIENIKKLTNCDYTNPFPEDEDDEIQDDWKGNKMKKKKKGKNNNYHEQSDNISDDNSNMEDSDTNSDDDDESDEMDDESDEEEKELMRELENLKREKLEKLKREKEEEELMKNKKNNVLTNNPLINLEDSDNEEFEKQQKKRKWTDEAIFRNTCEKKTKTNTFINDTVRTEFHKKFLFKYIH